MQNIVYAPSYQSIFLILSLRAESERLHVMTSHENLFQLLSEWKISVEKIPAFLNCALHHPFETIKLRKTVHRILSTFERNSKLHIAFNAYDIGGFYLAFQWVSHGSGRVIWRDLDPPRPRLKLGPTQFFTRCAIQTVSALLAARFLLGMKMVMVGTKIPVPGITIEVAERLGFCVNPIDNPAGFRLKMRSLAPILPIQCKYLIITDGTGAFDTSYFPEPFLKTIRQINSTVKGAGIKLHPTRGEAFLQNIGDSVPSYYPAEFLFHNTKVVVGVFSAALIAAAHTPGCKVISLIHLMQWKSNDAKEEALYFLNTEISDCKDVYYPQTVQETIQLLQSFI